MRVNLELKIQERDKVKTLPDLKADLLDSLAEFDREKEKPFGPDTSIRGSTTTSAARW